MNYRLLKHLTTSPDGFYAIISASRGENTPEQNAAVVRRVFAGEEGPVRDIVLLNAAAGIVTFDLVREPDSVDIPILDRLRVALDTAAQTVDSGAALAKLDAWVASTTRHAQAE